jgi:hypothetical protein
MVGVVGASNTYDFLLEKSRAWATDKILWKLPGITLLVQTALDLAAQNARGEEPDLFRIISETVPGAKNETVSMPLLQLYIRAQREHFCRSVTR